MCLEEGILDLGPETLDQRMAEAEVGHKVPVHHVEMEIVRAAVQQSPALVAQLRQVSVEDRGPDLGRHLARHLPRDQTSEKQRVQLDDDDARFSRSAAALGGYYHMLKVAKLISKQTTFTASDSHRGCRI